mgnify:CR=1 FL=1
MSRPLSKTQNLVAWIAALVAVVILGQTLYFKFTGQPESKYIFEKLGAEPWGRYGSGAVELLAVLLLLSPRTAAIGAVLAMGTMAGAIASHLGPLGVEVQGDGGTLFTLAIVTFVSAAIVAFLRRGTLPVVGARLAR